MNKLAELRQERGDVVAEMRKIHDLSLKEKRDYNADENKKYDDLEKRCDDLGSEIKRHERAAKLEGIANDLNESRRQAPNNSGAQTGGEGGENRGQETPEEKKSREFDAAFRSYVQLGRNEMPEDERRALSMGSQADGGFIVAPVQWSGDLLKAVDDEVFIKSRATVHRVRGVQKYGRPTLDTDPSDPDWTSEISTGSEDSAMKFGSRELEAHPLAKRIKVSENLLMHSNAESVVRGRLQYKFGTAQENSYMTGTGAGQPLGLFTASDDGISTGRDVTGLNTTSAIVADSLIDTKYTLKAQYYRNASWIFHRDAVKMIRKLKDSQNQYLWQPGLAADQQDKVLDLPFLTSEFAPNTFTASQYVGLLGDLRFYEILEDLDVRIKRLVELYAEANQIGFIGRYQGDGMPVLEEAFVRIKLAAA